MEVTQEIKVFIEKLATRAIDVGSLGEVSEYITEYTSQVEENDFRTMLDFAIEEKFQIPTLLLCNVYNEEVKKDESKAD